MIIAIHKDNPNKWVQLAVNAPLEEEILEDWYIFDMPEVHDLPTAVRIAKINQSWCNNN